MTSTVDDTSTPEVHYRRLRAFARAFHLYLFVNVAASTLALLLLLFLIVRYSPPGMRFLQWHLANCALSTYFNLVLMTVWQPVPAPPPFGGFCMGPLCTVDNVVPGLLFKVFTIVSYNHLSMCYLAGLIYQFHSVSLAFNSTAISLVMSARLNAAYTLTFVALLAGVLWGMNKGIDSLYMSHDDLRHAADRLGGGLMRLIVDREPTLIGYYVESLANRAFVGAVFCWMLALGAVSALFTRRLVATIRSGKQARLYCSTRDLQWMLYRAFAVKTLILLGTVFGPVLITFICFALRLDDFRLQFVGLFAVSIHPMLTYVHMILFFRPYRRYCRKWWRYCLQQAATLRGGRVRLRNRKAALNGGLSVVTIITTTTLSSRKN